MTSWTVYRSTPTAEVWACMGYDVEAETGLEAIREVAGAQPYHLQGLYFAVPDDAHVWANTSLRTERIEHLELEPTSTPEKWRA